MKQWVITRLCIMMFVEFFIWGAWYVTVGNYMGAHGMKDMIYWAYMVGPIAAIISPFFLGMIADRFFPTERVLAAMCILAGVAMVAVGVVAGMAESQVVKDAVTGELVAPKSLRMLFIFLLLAHMLCYMPTLGLTNTLAFCHLTNQEKQFPLIRVFGTIGWIVGNWAVSKWPEWLPWLQRQFAGAAEAATTAPVKALIEGDKSLVQFYITGAACVLLGVFSLVLPHTPPPAKGQKFSVRAALGLDALKLLKDPSFLIFVLSSLLICIPLAAYYSYAPVFVGAAGITNPATKMSFGQMSEIYFMLVMPLYFARLGVKKMLAIGMAAWVLRYALFSAGAPGGVFWMIITGVLLHGICYDFFFVTGFIYTDKKAPREIRAQAQGFLVLVTQGIGMLIGALAAGALFKNFVIEQSGAGLKAFQQFWLIPCLAAGAVLLQFVVLFRDDHKAEPPVGKSGQP